MSIGDFDTSSVVYFKFTTSRPSTGAPYTLAGSPAISVYKDNSTTQSTAGVTLTVDFDSVTGFNHVAIDTSADGTFYSAGSFFEVVLTAGTVDSVSAAGYVVGRFSLRKNSALKPTVAGRTLDVSSGGEAGLDWANVGSPTTTVGLTGTTISSSQAVASVSGAVGSVTGGVTVTTNNDKTGYSLSGSQAFNLTGDITGNLSGSVGSVSAAITLPTIPADWITSSGLASSAVSEIQAGLATSSEVQQVAAELPASIADAVWEDLEADHPVTGTMGAALGRTSAIKTKTDNLPADPADASDIADSFVTVNSKLDAIDDYIDTEVAAIKAKTDNLPSDPADASDIAASFVTVNSKLDAIDDYVDTEVAAIKVVTDKYATMIVQDGVVYQYTTNSLENGPSGGGGGGSTVAVYPLNATMPARVYDLNITFYKDEDGTVAGPIAITSRNANVFEPVDLSGRTLSVRFVDYEGTELLTVANGDITVSGADNNQISFPVTTALTGSVTEAPQDQWHIWTLHDLTSGDNVLIGGKARVLLC